MKATLSAKEKEEIFEKRAKPPAGDLIPTIIFIGCSVSFEVLAFASAADGNWGYAAVGSLVALFLLALGVGSFVESISSAKVRAVKQCLAVAEKFGVALTSWQVRELEANIYSGDVFSSFVDEIKKAKLELIPVGTFIGSGGTSEEAYRNLVEHLWQQTSPPPAVEAEEAESAQAKPA